MRRKEKGDRLRRLGRGGFVVMLPVGLGDVKSWRIGVASRLTKQDGRCQASEGRWVKLNMPGNLIA